ncbi:hypothetical protein EIP86_005776 [Pleurotus ostreatoroseus]|nr:hypothetical protein EIP86_005776 [Pleurotus ostreatoroseus]
MTGRSAAIVTASEISLLIRRLQGLSSTLPPSVPLAKANDKIYHVITSVHGDDVFHTFNRRFDALFGLDCRDQSGHMKYIRRGRFGMDAVCKFLESIDLLDESMQLTLMALRLNTLIKELEYHVGISDSRPHHVGASNAASKPSPATSEPLLQLNHKQVSTPKTTSSTAVKASERVEDPTAEGDTASSLSEPRKSLQPKNLKQQSLQDAFGGQNAISEPTLVRKDAARNPGLRQQVRRSAEKTQNAAQPIDVELNELDDPYEDEELPVSLSDENSVFEPSEDNESSSSDQSEGDTDINDGSALGEIESQKSVAATRTTKSSAAQRTATKKPAAGTTKRRRSSAGKYQRPPRPKKKKKGEKAGTAGRPLEVSSGEESDGQSALRDVESQEAKYGQKRGPENRSLQHWHDPIPVNDRKRGARWEFKCRYCSAVKRTVVTTNPSIDDEPRLPFLGNLGTHVKDKHPDALDGKDVEEDGIQAADHGYTLKSAQMMAAFLKEGELNPRMVPTYKGFLRLFSAWILDEDLPFTTGEAPSLRNLFKYLHVNFALPSDTTVRNTLAHIFTELHGKVVRELTNIKSRIAYSTDTWSTRQMVFTFAGTIASFVNEDWELVERLVSFQHLDDNDHKGEYAAKVFVNGAAKRGGLDKMSTTLSSLNCD